MAAIHHSHFHHPADLKYSSCRMGELSIVSSTIQYNYPVYDRNHFNSSERLIISAKSPGKFYLPTVLRINASMN